MKNDLSNILNLYLSIKACLRVIFAKLILDETFKIYFFY